MQQSCWIFWNFWTVLDDEDSNIITAGSIVTVNVHLKRRSMSDLFNQDCPPQFISIANAANAALVDDVDDLTAAGFSGEDTDHEEEEEEKEGAEAVRHPRLFGNGVF